MSAVRKRALSPEPHAAIASARAWRVAESDSPTRRAGRMSVAPGASPGFVRRARSAGGHAGGTASGSERRESTSDKTRGVRDTIPSPAGYGPIAPHPRPGRRQTPTEWCGAWDEALRGPLPAARSRSRYLRCANRLYVLRQVQCGLCGFWVIGYWNQNPVPSTQVPGPISEVRCPKSVVRCPRTVNEPRVSSLDYDYDYDYDYELRVRWDRFTL